MSNDNEKQLLEKEINKITKNITIRKSHLRKKLQEETERGKQLPSYKLLQEVAKEEIKCDDVDSLLNKFNGLSDLIVEERRG